MGTIYKILIACILICSQTSCMGQEKSIAHDETIWQKNNTLFANEVGDSIVNLVLKAKCIYLCCDSAKVKLDANETTVAKYIVSDTCNLKKGLNVDGYFHNYLSLMFVSKKDTITFMYDFSLEKMQIRGKNDIELSETDIKDYGILRLGLLAFPDNKYLNRFKQMKK